MEMFKKIETVVLINILKPVRSSTFKKTYTFCLYKRENVSNVPRTLLIVNFAALQIDIFFVAKLMIILPFMPIKSRHKLIKVGLDHSSNELTLEKTNMHSINTSARLGSITVQIVFTYLS